MNKPTQRQLTDAAAFVALTALSVWAGLACLVVLTARNGWEAYCAASKANRSQKDADRISRLESEVQALNQAFNVSKLSR